MAAGKIVLDFSAGSCTTAHAVMKLNKENGGNRRFIMVQWTGKCGEKSEAFQAGYKTIADIGKERIRLAAKQIGSTASFKVWDNAPSNDAKEIQERIQLHVNNLNPKSSKEDVLYEILLKSGYPITTRIEKKNMAGKNLLCEK